MGAWIKNNLVLISGITLPVLLVAGFLVLSQVPRMMADPPGYDFVLVAYQYDYQRPGNYYLTFEVRDGHLSGRVVPKSEGDYNQNRHHAAVFRYLAADNSFEEIPFDLPEGVESIEEPVALELKAIDSLSLDKRVTSPDGYRFEFLGSRGRGGLLGELFGMNRRYESDYVLTKGNAHFDLPVPSRQPQYYSHDLQFMGWVIEEGAPP